MESNEPVQLIPVLTGKSNSFLVRNSTSCLIIDTGIPSTIRTFLKVFKENDIDPSVVDLIIITHTHNDHCGNAAELKKICNAQLLVHKSEADHLSSGFTPFPKGTSFLPNTISKLVNLLLKGKRQFNPVEPDILVERDFDLEEFGFDGRVIAVPGHTKGSLCVVLKKEAAFVGDTMFNIFPNTVFPPFANDPETLERSWYKIIKSGATIFYPGHGHEFDLDKLKKSLVKLKQ